MNQETIALVQGSWRVVEPISGTAADLFYGKLFELDPTLKFLFPSDLAEQKRKLMQTLGVAVNGLNDLGKLSLVLRDLGTRHVAYGVLDEHYDVVGQALLWTLERGLGEAFTADVRAAWGEVYAAVADTMKGAAREVPAGPVSPYTVRLVQHTWELVKPISEQAAQLFYGKLFELDPAVKPLFKSDLKSQGRKLMQTLSVAVNGLSDVAGLVPVLQDLGKRHLSYGVRDEHYDTVGVALLWTLEQGLGDAFTADVKRAWGEIYGVVAQTMRTAAAAAA